ncbi:unnamed protein product [Adineta ricciae]|uniref:Peptidase M28 domain-containing protein n=1 Tax=Adineta ricciae TaxID=249248 RepID=A0A815XNR7_ADIRI|nr:unnamed protein product [Adineta ricciae]CAF1559648.1 unnamed protein product [Adineta ricciae]
MVEEIALVPHDDIQTHQANIHVINRIFHSKYSSNQFLLWVLSFVCLLLIAGPLTSHISYSVPAMKTRDIPAHMFSEERTRDYLANLTRFGSRVINTQGNYAAREYLISQIETIFSRSNRQLRFELVRQNTTDLESNRLENILVRVSNASMESEKLWNVLLSAHYDSVEFSSGSSDDGSGVVILLELLSNLVNDVTMTLSNLNLILIFTDAEEIGLHGSEAFRSSHSWFRNIHRFINVDSVRCNQVANLIQIRSSQLAIEYSHVPKPRANFILQNICLWLGIRTDYDMYSLYNQVLGYNFGFFFDGYTYHTPFDDLATIKFGVLQELGDNLLVLIRNTFLQYSNVTDNDSLIYFDILGRYLMIYKRSTSLFIQRTLSLLLVMMGLGLITIDHVYHQKKVSPCHNCSCIYVQYKHPLTIRFLSILIYSASNLLSLANAFLCSIAVAFIMSITKPFSWFGSPFIATLLFGLPCLVGMLIIGYSFTRLHHIVRRRFRQQEITIESFDFEQNVSMMISFVGLMIVSAIWKNPLLYMILIWTVFIFPIYLFVIIVEFVCHWREIPWRILHRKYYWLYLPLLVSLFPLAHSLETVDRLLRILIPIFTRRYFEQWSFDENHLICCIIAIPTMLSVLIFIPILQKIKCFGRAFNLFSVFFLLIWMIAFVRQPFTSKHPNTFYAQHISNTTYVVENFSRIAMNASLLSRSSSITARLFAGARLSPILDEFSVKSGHRLQNRRCLNRMNCVFDDTFNRSIAVESIRIEPNHTIIIQHVPSYHIFISASFSTEFHIRNQWMIPRTTTIVDLVVNSNVDLVKMDIIIRRCDLHQSPFLLLFTRFISHVIPMGDAVCQAIEDNTKLLVNFHQNG